MFSSSRLVDETGEVQCTLFCQELERLPKIENIGDIVRLHRVGVSGRVCVHLVMGLCAHV